MRVVYCYKSLSFHQKIDQGDTNFAQQSIYGLLRSPKFRLCRNFVYRRLAVATILPYIRAKNEETKICLEILNSVMKEKDKDVKKAIGWALREISKKNEEETFNFLKKMGNLQR